MTSADAATVAERKHRLRPQMRARRMAMPAAARAVASRGAAWAALSGLPWRDRPEVALFWPLADEIDTLRRQLADAEERGARLAAIVGQVEGRLDGAITQLDEMTGEQGAAR